MSYYAEFFAGRLAEHHYCGNSDKLGATVTSYYAGFSEQSRDCPCRVLPLLLYGKMRRDFRLRCILP
jgi:hypothetical protein